MKMNRLEGVEFFRMISIFSVIIIHACPFEKEYAPIGTTLDIATMLNQICRFAVPFFAVVSGYFWAEKFNEHNKVVPPTLRMAKRLIWIFVVWSMIYMLPTNIFESFQYGLLGPIKVSYWHALNLLNHPVGTLFQGSRIHLWFLVGLLSSLVICALILLCDMEHFLILIASIFYLVGLAGKAYTNTPVGFQTEFDMRNGPFFLLLFFATGYKLQRAGRKDSWFVSGILMAVFGFCLHFFELIMLHKYFGTTMKQDYVIGTYFMGVGMGMIALSNKIIFKIFSIANIASLTLGIYAIHVFFIDLLSPFKIISVEFPAWEVIRCFSVFILSYFTVYILSKNKLTKIIVT